MRALIPALQGRNMTARGEAPGNASPKPSPALKGRHNLPFAARGLAREAEQAESKPDFIHKMAIALKEANETEYWILLLRETNYLTVKESESILADTVELLKLLTSIIKSAKRSQVTMDN